jgi:hypothetical protein
VTLIYPEIRARLASSRKSKLVNVPERIAKFLVEQVITVGGKFHADETMWAQIMYGN